MKGSPSHNNNAIPLWELFAEKLENAKKRFSAHAAKHGLTEKLQALTVEQVQVELLSQRMMWALLEGEETEFLLSLAEGAKTSETAVELDRFVTAVRDLSEDDLKLAWRYVRFFISCLKV